MSYVVIPSHSVTIKCLTAQYTINLEKKSKTFHQKNLPRLIPP